MAIRACVLYCLTALGAWMNGKRRTAISRGLWVAGALPILVLALFAFLPMAAGAQETSSV